MLTRVAMDGITIGIMIGVTIRATREDLPSAGPGSQASVVGQQGLFVGLIAGIQSAEQGFQQLLEVA